MKTRSILAGIGFAAAVMAGGCGGDDGDSAAIPQFNDADVEFAQGMIPHHQQALEMAEMAAQQAANPEVKSLAPDIEQALDPEIETMTGWLEEWGAEVPSEMPGSTMEGMGGMPMEDMPGMMSEEQMTELGSASGVGFDQMFLSMMIEHHEGAVEMAQTEQADGENPDAVALAEQIESDMTAEIATMQALLGL